MFSGSVQKQIEQETGVKIIFPSAKEETLVGKNIPIFLSEIMFNKVAISYFQS